jgi:hypothetical protein
MMSPTDLGFSSSHWVRVTTPMEAAVSESFEADLEPDTTTVSFAVDEFAALWPNAELHMAITISATGVCLNNVISIFLNNSHTLIGYFIQGKSATQVSNLAVITHGKSSEMKLN